jgi:glycerol-3-phosphate dehydrogenase
VTNDEQLQRDLEQMSDSPAVAKQIKESLRRLTDGVAGPELAELARDILDGRINLRIVARSAAYADQMTEAMGRFRRWQADLTPEQRDQLVTDTRAYLFGQPAQSQ